jgi:enoyl reductase-like protein
MRKPTAVRAIEKSRKASLMERVKAALIEALSGSEREPSEQQNKEADMSVSKEQFDALSGEVKTLSESLNPDALANSLAAAIGTAVAAAIKPLTEAQEAVANSQKAKDDAELTELVGKIVAANLMDEATAKELTLNAARALVKQAEPGKAAPLANGFKPRTGEKKGHVAPKAVN